MADHAAVTSNAKFLDALDRAWRTIKQGILLDASVAIGGGMLVLMETGDITSPVFWSALGILVGKSLLMSVAAFLHRMKSDPKVIEVSPEA